MDETSKRHVFLLEPSRGGEILRGGYVVVEERPDGALLLRRETVDQVIEQFCDRSLTEEEQEEAFRRIAAAAEG